MWVQGIVLMIGTVVLALLAWKCLEFEKSGSLQKLQIQELIASLKPAAPLGATPQTPLSRATTQAKNSAIQKLNVPWRDLLNAVERATPKNIALLSLDPDASNSMLVVVGEAGNPDSMLNYVNRLKEQDFFSDVRLVMHEINQQDPFAPYRFQIEAHWRETPP